MIGNQCSRRWAFLSLMAAIMIAAPMLDLHAQIKQLRAWQDGLASLKDASSDELVQQQTSVVQIRNAVEFWLKYNPSSRVSLPPAPPQPWNADEIRNQASLLAAAVETIVQEDPNRPFNLGATEVSVTVEASSLSPMSDTLSRNEIGDRQLLTVSTALDALPGVAIDHAAGPRNEAQARIRGFSTRGQVPFYLDGIPIYIPYDGYVDLNRFLASDYSEVQVSKGYSSPLMGPNGLAGSINLITKEPQKKLETEALLGTGSGGMLLSSVRLGSRWDHFYVEGAFDWLDRDFTPLSGNYRLNRLQSNYERNLSATRDQKYSGRVAWTPKANDQYSFTFMSQKGKKTGLQYIGPNENATYNRFWKWPYWNKNGYYLITNTGIGESSSIKFRAYYDQFRNGIDMFDDGTYSTMNNSRSENSRYNDHTQGASSEFTTRLIPHNNISASIFFKDDTHTSRDYYPHGGPRVNGVNTPLLRPDQFMRDQLASIGLQDALAPLPRLRVVFGFSADHLNGLEARDVDLTANRLTGFRCFTNPSNTSSTECTSHMWTVNPQVSASYTLSASDTFFMIFSDRGRFPMLKERYSYGMGSSVPNPSLKPERSRNWDIGYTRSFAARTLLQIDYFRSDLRDAIQSVYVRDIASLCTTNTGVRAGYCGQSFNIGTEVHQGAEVTIRSAPMRRLVLDANYTYINRTLSYNYANLPDVSTLATTIVSLPSMPKNKFVGNVTVSLPRQILAMATLRMEGGMLVQDTTWNRNDPMFRNNAPLYLAVTAPYSTYNGTVDVGTVIPIKAGLGMQAGVKNLFDRDYYYSAGYPEAGRNWYFNMKYTF